MSRDNYHPEEPGPRDFPTRGTLGLSRKVPAQCGDANRPMYEGINKQLLGHCPLGHTCVPSTKIQPKSSAVGCCDVTVSHMLPGEGTTPALDTEPANSPTESLSPLSCLTAAGEETWAPWERRRTQGRGLLGHQQLADGAEKGGRNPQRQRPAPLVDILVRTWEMTSPVYHHDNISLGYPVRSSPSLQETAHTESPRKKTGKDESPSFP